MSRIVFSSEEEKAICEEYLSGEYKAIDVAKKHNVHKDTIYRVLRDNNITLRGRFHHLDRKFTKEQEKEICEQYLDGKSTIAVGKLYGVYHATIINILKRNNIDRRSKRAFSENTEKEICLVYKNDLESTIDSLAEKHNAKFGAVYGALRRAGLVNKKLGIKKKMIRNERERQKILQDKQIVEDICNLYIDGVSLDVLQKKYSNLSRNFIVRILKENNATHIEDWASNKKYYFNQNFFNTINDEPNAYWLGFIIADGTNHEDKKLSIGLALKDIEHLKHFQRVIEDSRPLDIREVDSPFGKGMRCRLTISSIQLVADLKSLGIIQNKTGKEYIPDDIPDNLMRHLCRALVDGDGSVSRNSANGDWSVSLKGNFNLLKQFDAWVMPNAGIERPRKPQETHSKGTFEIQYNGNLQAFKVGSLLYENSHPYCRLERKYNKYLEVKENFINNIRIDKRFTVADKCNLLVERVALV